jgi:hypothetical protein
MHGFLSLVRLAAASTPVTDHQSATVFFSHSDLSQRISSSHRPPASRTRPGSCTARFASRPWPCTVRPSEPSNEWRNGSSFRWLILCRPVEAPHPHQACVTAWQRRNSSARRNVRSWLVAPHPVSDARPFNCTANSSSVARLALPGPGADRCPTETTHGGWSKCDVKRHDMVFGRTSFTVGMEFLHLNGWPRKLPTAPKLDSDAFPLCTLRREAPKASPSRKECNYEIRAGQSSASLTKFIVNYINIYVFE